MAKNFLVILLTIFTSFQVLAASGVTYHGRILKPNGEPVAGQFVGFRLRLMDGDTGSCQMYEEIQTKDMRNSGGVFSIVIGDGSVVGTYGVTGIALFDGLFQNAKTFNFAVGNSCELLPYTAGARDGRKLNVSFRESPTDAWEDMPTMSVEYVPFAFSSLVSQKVGNHGDGSLLRVENAGTPQSIPALTPTQYSELFNLVQGDSTQYVQSVLGTAGQITVNTTTGVATVGLPDVATAGIYGSATQVPVFTLDAKGRITAVTNTTITGAAPTGVAGGDLTGNYPNPDIAASAVGTAEIAALAVTDAKLAANSVTTTKILDANVTLDKLATDSVNSAKIVDGSIVGADISSTAALSVASVTATGAVTSDSVSTRSIGLFELPANGVNYIAMKAPDLLAGNTTYTWPAAAPGSNMVLQSDASGNLSWVADATGTSPGDATYATKGIVQFDTDAATSGINISGGIAKLATSGVAASAYGTTAAKTVSITVDAFGRITAASEQDIAVNASAITAGILPIARGGTNSGTALNNNRMMISSGGAIVEAPAMLDGQIMIGSTGAAPIAATLTAGTGVTINNTAGGIEISAAGSGGTITALTGDVVASGTGSVTATIQPNAVDAGKLASDAVTTLKVADDAITFAKIQNITDNRLLGRSAGTNGDMQEITVGTGLSLSGGNLTATATAPDDASYTDKGIVRFDTDAATSGISITGGVAKLATSGVAANTYGAADKVPVMTVDAFGRITSAADSSIAIAASAITSGILDVARGGTGVGTLTANRVPIVNGTGTALTFDACTIGQVLEFNGTTWACVASSSLGAAVTAAGNTGEIQFNNGGAFAADSALFWDNTSKRLGIGTAPTQALTVSGTVLSTSTGANPAIRGDSVANGNGVQGNNSANGIGVLGSNTSNGYGVSGTASNVNGIGVRGSNTTGVGVFATTTGASNTSYALQAVNNSATGWGLYSSGTSPNYFAGDVGVGTTGPSAKLDVKGTFAISGSTSGAVKFAVPAAAGSATYTWPAAAPASNMVLQSDASGNLSWVADATGGGGSQWTTTGLDIYYDTGKVGIGTTTPVVANHIYVGSAMPATSGSTPSAGTAIRIENSVGNGVLDIGTNNTNQWIQSTNKGGLGTGLGLLLNPNGGNVGINTKTAPVASLDVKGDFAISGSTSGAVKFAVPAVAGSATYTWPAAAPASNMVLQSDSSGVLSWVAAGGGGGLPAADGSAAAPSINFASSTGTGFYYAGTDFIGVALGGVYKGGFLPGQAYFADSQFTGVGFSANSGSAATPVFNFSSDTNTGMYRAAADTLAFSTNGTERVRVDSSGNMGIGTTSSGAKLDVKGNISMSGSTSGAVTFAVPAVAGSATYTWPAAAPASNMVLQSDSSGVLSWVAAGGGGSGDFMKDGSVAMTGAMVAVDNSGVSPSIKSPSGNSGIGFTGFDTIFYSAGSQVGSINLGAVDFSSVVVKGSYFAAQANGSASGPAFSLYSGGGMYSPGTDIIGFSTANTERMRIDASGNVGIGTTAAANGKLDVKGTFAMSGSTSGAVKFAVPAAAGSATYTWPAAAPASNMVLQSDSSGVLSWVAAGGGGSGDFMKDGSVAMTGQFKATNGSTGAPSISFASDPTTGLYYTSGGPNVKVSIGGTTVMDISNGVFATNFFMAPNFYAQGGGGTAGMPAFALDSDSNTGLFSTGNDMLGLSTNGAERLRITPTGDVGIGTTPSSAKLDVKGTFAISGSTSGAVKFAVPAAAGSATYTWPAAAPASNMVLQSDNTGTLSWVAGGGGSGDFKADGTVPATDTLYLAQGALGTGGVSFDGDADTGIITPTANVISIFAGGSEAANFQNSVNSMLRNTYFPAGLVGTPGISFSADSNTGIYRPAADTVGITTNGTERLRIDTKVDVKGNFAISGSSSGAVTFAVPAAAGSATYTWPASAPASNMVLQSDSSGALSWVAAGGGGSGDFMKDGSVAMTGNFKLGANYLSNDGGASEGLSFTTAGTATITTNNTGVSSGLTLSNTSGTAGSSNDLAFMSNFTPMGNIRVQYQTTNSNMQFYTRTGGSVTEKMRIDDSGNVGIGTSPSGAKLDVKGTVAISGSSSGAVKFAVPAAAGSATYTWPAAAPASDMVLQSNSSGTLSWVAAGGGGGGLPAADGSMASPSISFANDTDTGMYRVGSNVIGFTNNGNISMEVSSTSLDLFNLALVLNGGAGLSSTGPIYTDSGITAIGNVVSTGRMVAGVSTDADALSALTVSFSASNMIRATAASGACGTLNFTNVAAGGSYTVTIPNATATCTAVQLNGSTTNVKLPSGYGAGGVACAGAVYTAIYDGTTLWVSYVPF